MRAIDAEELKRSIAVSALIDDQKTLEQIIDEQPTIEERKTGKWIYLTGVDAFECSVCGRQMVRNIFDYCPWCGARMSE